jgi:hypothetical protein
MHHLSGANIALLSKKDGAEDVSDFRPISLIHAIAKIIFKVLALRLGPFMNDLVSNAQSALIKRRSIHDNFLYVQNLAKRSIKARLRHFYSSLTSIRPLILLDGNISLTFSGAGAFRATSAIGSPSFYQPHHLACS